MQAVIYGTAALVLVGVVLLVAVLRAVRMQTSPTSAGSYIDGRLSGLDRGNEAVRRAITEMDIGLRGVIASGTREGLDSAFKKVQEGTKSQAEGLASVQQALNQLADTVRTGIEGFSQRLGQEQEQLRGKVEAKLDEIRTGNEAKLEQMRLTVDEKLQTTLEQRLGASFKQVSDSLEQVYKSVGEMQALAVGVGDLKRLLSNVKARGVWTENLCGALLSDVLAPGQYERNVEIKPGSNQRVEYAIRLPGDEEKPVWLPIDVKFPQADYERLSEAANRGDADAVETHARAIEVFVRAAAREISSKYLDSSHSTDFGVMFLPTEGLFAEVVRRPGLIDALQREHHIMIAGPTTLLTLLTAFRMGFRSLAIQKRSAEVWRVLGAVKQEFAKFGGAMDKVSKKLDEAQKVIEDEVGRRRRAMERQLRAVEVLPEGEAAALLEYEAAEITPLDEDQDEARSAAE